MPKERRVHIVLPAYNESAVIRSVVEGVDRQLNQIDSRYEMTIVNDGSTDHTSEVVQELAKRIPIRLIEHKENLGLGAALKSGLYPVIESADPDDIILVMEADHTQPTSNVRSMLLAIEGGVDLVIASPLKGQNGFHHVPIHRRVLSYSANSIYHALFPLNEIQDFTNLVRGFRASLLKEAYQYYGPDRFIDRKGFEAVPDLLIKLRRFQPKSTEIESIVDYSKLCRKSSIMIFPTLIQSLKLCFKHLTSD